MADKEEGSTRKRANSGGINVADLMPMNAFCCEIESCFFDFPACLGCYSNCTYCCQTQECKCCKVGTTEGECCLCTESRCVMVMPTTCCKGINQCCCIDERVALPCDRDVPCLCTICFITCCYNWQCKVGCCQTIGQMDPSLKTAVSPA